MSGKKKKLASKILLPFIIIGVLAILFALSRVAAPDTKDVYLKIKVSQGFWWASSAKPNIWYAQAIKKGDIEYNLLKKPIAEILEVRYYPFYSEAQPAEDKYDIYLKVKIAANYDQGQEQYSFKRSAVVVGSPIELETSSSLINGTIIEVSEADFNDKYVEKTITLVKERGYSRDNPYVFNGIKVGEKYYDGEQFVFEILDKNLVGYIVLIPDQYGNLYSRQTSSVQNIIVRAKILVREKDNLLFFGEEKLLSTGNSLVISTPGFKFDSEFIIGDIR